MLGQECQRTLNRQRSSNEAPANTLKYCHQNSAGYIESKTGQNFCDDDPQVWHGHVHRHLYFLCIGILNVCRLCFVVFVYV